MRHFVTGFEQVSLVLLSVVFGELVGTRSVSPNTDLPRSFCQLRGDAKSPPTFSCSTSIRPRATAVPASRATWFRNGQDF